MHKGGVHRAWEMGIEDKAELTPVSDLQLSSINSQGRVWSHGRSLGLS